MRHSNFVRAGRSAALVLLAALVLTGCGMFKTKSKDDALKDLEWQYERDALVLEINADPQLNTWGGQAHTILMVVAQMAEPSVFEPYSSRPDQLSSLLMADSAPTGLLSMDRIFVEPGVKRRIRLARMDKARYVAVALGYQHLDPARSTRLYQFGAKLESHGLMFREYEARPEPLRIRLRLGPQAIVESQTDTVTPPAATLPTAGAWPAGQQNK
ncbi:type VI secretion system lipoprotein TssJ [Alcaligenes sp. SDU_A2]|uniref:type VI secretion system lipoprotein TssJ n=1 Tax=Alcaligenes sp. SDU_A2 TaxID=3136634 RepID=UPI00311EFF0F